MPVTAPTTALPDEDRPRLVYQGPSDPDAVLVDRETAVSDTGNVRYQIRESSASSWSPSAAGFDEVVVDYDTLGTTFTGLTQDVAYEVRGRTETQHATGAWTTPTAVLTTEAVTNLSISTVSITSLDLSWTDPVNNEDQFQVERRTTVGGTTGSFQAIATLAPNTTSYTDGSVTPDTTYEYRVVAEVNQHETASTVTSATTPAINGVNARRVPASGWYVEIDTPSGQVVTPTILESPTRNQQINDLPELTVPVPQSDTWQAEAYEDAPMRVWYDGDRQPVERLARVEQTKAQGRARTTLVAEGGVELRTRVQTHIDFADAHTALETLVQNNTSYVTNVDNPVSTTDTVTMQTPDSQADLSALLVTSPPAATTPVTLTGAGTVETLRTAWYEEGETANGFPNLYETNTGFSNERARILESQRLNSGNPKDFAETTITLDYDVPAGSFEIIAALGRDAANGHPEFSVYFDGAKVQDFAEDAIQPGSDPILWSRVDVSGTVAAGSHTVTIQINDHDSDGTVGNGRLLVDIIGAADKRYSRTFDTQTNSQQALDGPETYPDSVPVTFTDAVALNQVVAGACDVSVDNPTGAERIELSNDSGSTYPVSATDADTVSGSFPSDAGQIRTRITIGRHGTRTDTTPTQGFKPTVLDGYELRADQESTPALENRSVDDLLVTFLQRAASQKDFIWELQWDDTADTLSFEMTRPGQRTSPDNPEVVQYDITKSTADVIEQATVKGGARGTQEDFTSNHGTAVALGADDLVRGSEVVLDPSTGTTFAAGSDYNIDHLNGTITTLSAGNISDSTTYRIRYRHQAKATYTEPGVTDPKEAVESFPSLISEQTARNLAFVLVNRFSEPVYSATVTIPTSVGWSVIDEIDASRVPTAGRSLQLANLETSPEAVVAELETQNDPEDVIQRVRSRLSATESRV